MKLSNRPPIIVVLFFLSVNAFADCITPSLIPTNNGEWLRHRCGSGTPPPPVCADSVVPPAAPLGTALPLPYDNSNFNNLMNPMAACCGLGWGEDDFLGQKLDCVEAVPPTTGFQTFREFYNFGSSRDIITTARLTFPNRMFVLGKDGVPLNGFYDQTGRRCNYRNPTTKVLVTLTAPQQMAIIAKALTDDRPPSGTTPAEVDPLCCQLVTFALERRCPEQDRNPPGSGPRLAATAVGPPSTRRCTAAKEMKLHFAVFDLCAPAVVKRGRFRVSTSWTGENPKFATIVRTQGIQISNLISEFHPTPATPLPSPTPAPSPCPVSPALYEIPWTGMCRLRAPEPTPTP